MDGTEAVVVADGSHAPSARSKAPVFVVGCPRSGTTLLYHMLLSAGNFVVYRSESQVFNLLGPRFGNLSSRRNKRKLLAAWQASPLFAKTGLEARQIEQEVMAKCQNPGDFLRVVMGLMARQQGVERWAECTPEHLLSLQRIKETIPDAIVIHIIRDGRDVALSLAKQKWIRPFLWDRGGNLHAAALYWEWIVRRGRENGKHLGPDYLEVHYEDLVGHPRATLARLSAFVGQVLDRDHIEEVGIGSVSTPNSSFKSEADSGQFRPVERWKQTLAGDPLMELEGLVGETLLELGYARAASPLKDARLARLARKRALYQRYFDAKWTLKNNTPLGRLFVTRDLSWV